MIIDKSRQGLIVVLLFHLRSDPVCRAVAERVSGALLSGCGAPVAAAFVGEADAFRSLEHKPSFDEGAFEKFCDETEECIRSVEAGEACLAPDLRLMLLIATELLKFRFLKISPVSSPSSNPLQAAIDDFRTARQMRQSLDRRQPVTS